MDYHSNMGLGGAMLEHYKREHCKRLMSKLTNIVLGCHLVVFIFLQKDIVYFYTEQFVCIPVCVCVCVLQRLTIAKVFGDKSAERRAYSNLGNAHIFLGNFTAAAEFYQ